MTEHPVAQEIDQLETMATDLVVAAKKAPQDDE